MPLFFLFVWRFRNVLNKQTYIYSQNKSCTILHKIFFYSLLTTTGHYWPTSRVSTSPTVTDRQGNPIHFMALFREFRTRSVRCYETTFASEAVFLPLCHEVSWKYLFFCFWLLSDSKDGYRNFQKTIVKIFVSVPYALDWFPTGVEHLCLNQCKLYSYFANINFESNPWLNNYDQRPVGHT